MEYDVGKIISILSHQIKRTVGRTEAENGLTGVQGRILHFIFSQSRQGEVFQRDIEEEFNLRRSTATGILKLMEKNGMIHRESVPYDARLKSLILTEKALGIHEKVHEEIQNLEKRLAQNIKKEELQVFFKVSKQMLKNLDS